MPPQAAYNTNIPLEIFKEEKWFIAHCPILDLSAQGETPEDAKESFKDALELILADMIERKTLDQYLTKLGWKKISKPRKHWVPPAFVRMMDTPIHIPA